MKNKELLVFFCFFEYSITALQLVVSYWLSCESFSAKLQLLWVSFCCDDEIAFMFFSKLHDLSSLLLWKFKHRLFSDGIVVLISGGTSLSVKSITYLKSSATTIGMEMSGTTLSESTAKVATWTLPSIPSISGSIILNFSAVEVLIQWNQVTQQ